MVIAPIFVIDQKRPFRQPIITFGSPSRRMGGVSGEGGTGMKRFAIALLLLLTLAVSGAGLTLTEVGFRFDLALNPFRVDVRPPWREGS